MKNRILPIVTLSVVLLGITRSTFAATTKSANFIVVNEISKINKIEIHGNVELYVSDGSADQVKVYNHYYAESALVQNKEGVLRITSYTPEKLVVWVTANDLRSISAYDNAEVKSFGELSKIDLDVDLHDNAIANLNLDVYNANLTLTDYSKANLTGTADQLNLNHNGSSTVKDSAFSVVHFIDNNTSTPSIIKKEEIVGV